MKGGAPIAGGVKLQGGPVDLSKLSEPKPKHPLQQIGEALMREQGKPLGMKMADVAATEALTSRWFEEAVTPMFERTAEKHGHENWVAEDDPVMQRYAARSSYLAYLSGRFQHGILGKNEALPPTTSPS